MGLKKTTAMVTVCALLTLAQTAEAQRRRRRRAKGRISIKSAPTARVFIKGSLKGRTPLTVNAPPGRHRVVLKAAGRKSVSFTVRVRPGRKTTVFKRLPPRVRRGSLAVRSTPPAKLYLDGKLLGRTPKLNIKLPQGNHRVKLVTGSGRVWSRTVRIRPGKPTRISHRFPPRFGRLTINSRPSAKVFLDGKLVGTTPVIRGKIRPGKHKVVLRKPGFRPVTKHVVVRPGKSAKVIERLQRRARHGWISVKSRPSGASVYLDGRRKGRTPLRIKATPGRHILRFKTPKRGWRKKMTVRVRAGRTTRVNVKLR